MESKIFVIHRSEIVRRGLLAILRNYFNVEFIQLNTIKELKAFELTEKHHIILFVEYQESLDQSSIFKLQKSNTVKTIGICNRQASSNNLLGFNQCITINEQSKEIAALVSAFFNQQEQPKNNKHEGEELSRREKDVLQLVALGNTNQQIADKLFISIHTVISHRKNITEKLGIKSISGLTVYAILNKLIDAESIDLEELI